MPRRRATSLGFSLTELLMVIAIIGLINGLTVAFTGQEWQRERVNAAAIGLAGWLEEVRGQALRETSDTPDAGGCVVSFATLNHAPAGSTLATVSPGRCAASASFLIPAVTNSHDRYTTTTNATTITFTPRGSVTSSSDAVVNILLVGSRQLRCVRVSAILGVVRIGSSSTANSSADTCTNDSQF